MQKRCQEAENAGFGFTENAGFGFRDKISCLIRQKKNPPGALGAKRVLRKAEPRYRLPLS